MFKLGRMGLVYESSLWDSWSMFFNRMGMTTRKHNVEKIFEHVCFHEKEIMDMHKILGW